MRAASLLLLLVLPSPARGDPIRWYVLPNVAFDTDDGLGFGARGELAVATPGYEPYRTAYVVHAFATLRGYHHHRFRLDRVGLGRGRRVRVTLHLAWRQWLNDGYWGIGNGTAVERAYADGIPDDDPRLKRYRYSLYQPFTHLAVRVRLDRGFSLFSAFSPRFTAVRTYPGSLLEEQRPFGMDGGLSLPLTVGLLYDSRQPEADPQRGLFAELGARVSGQPTGARGVFGALHVTLRGYLRVARWLVLAGRVMTEVLFGDIPFYEMVHWGGSIPVAGFGGFETLRGIPFGRWRAPGKAVLNLEARFRLFAHTIFRRPIYWQLGLFCDSGLVFAEGERATAPSPRQPLHVSGGGGIRAVFQETFVARLDTGVGLDTIRELDGRETYTPSIGLYIVFDQAF
jgi:hypothetical protein